MTPPEIAAAVAFVREEFRSYDLDSIAACPYTYANSTILIPDTDPEIVRQMYFELESTLALTPDHPAGPFARHLRQLIRNINAGLYVDFQDPTPPEAPATLREKRADARANDLGSLGDIFVDEPPTHSGTTDVATTEAPIDPAASPPERVDIIFARHDDLGLPPTTVVTFSPSDLHILKNIAVQLDQIEDKDAPEDWGMTSSAFDYFCQKVRQVCDAIEKST